MTVRPSLQARVFEVLDPDDRPAPVERALNLALSALIVLNVAGVVLGSVPAVERRFGAGLHLLELFSLGVFSVEYAGRVWTAPMKSGALPGWRGRLRWIFSVMGLIDLGVLLALALPGLGGLTAFRSLRLLKLVSILKFGRYSGSLSLIGRVLRSRREELLTTVLIVFVLVLIAATALFNLERGNKGFESIPAAMWWAIVTLTTVGYGDTYPLTGAGRAVAGFVMLLGIGIVALPAGLIASGFNEELQRRKTPGTGAPDQGHAPTPFCPHCGARRIPDQAPTEPFVTPDP